MLKKQLLILVSFCSFCFIGCHSTDANKKVTTDDNISLEVTLERNTSSPYPLDITYKLTNLSDKTVYYESIAVPSNGYTLNNFILQEDGVKLEYKGPLVLLTGISFKSLAPGETYSTFVSLDKIYKVTQGTHNYIISYRGGMRAKTSDGETEIDSPEDKNKTSKIVPVKSNTLELEATINQIREPY